MFKTFEIEHKCITDMLAFWDRTVLAVRRPPTPSAASELQDEAPAGPAANAQASGKKAGRGGAGKKGAAEKAEKAEKEKPKVDF